MAEEYGCPSNMASPFFTDTFSRWCDPVSLALTSVAILTNGIEPVRPLWGYPWHGAFLQCLTMSSLVIFTAFRLYLEVTSAITAPREFLAISVVYLARWIYFYYSLRSSSALPGRLFRVARSLRMLATLRVGASTYHDRRGEQEIVVRSGARKATGENYWRGKIDRQQAVGRGWLVHLVEEQMHCDLLSELGTVEYARLHKTNTDLYLRVYQTVMNVEGAGEPRVDWTRFLSEYSAIAKTNLAMRAGATSDGDLAGVARRVAADACLYVAGKCAHRTDAQVALINSCVEDIARELANQFQQETQGDDSRS